MALRSLITTSFASNTRFMCSSAKCGWDIVLSRARCKKEPMKLDNEEECRICVPQPERVLKIYEDDLDLSAINGVPDYVLERGTAIIQRRTKNPMQSGTANTHTYILRHVREMSWENPLMGWNSSGTSLNGIEIEFPSAQSAEDFAKKYGWSVMRFPEDGVKTMPKKEYGLNFSWNKRTRRSTK